MPEASRDWKGVALLLIDIQNDFISGSLAVEGAESILPTVKRLIHDYPFQTIVSSQDYHPPSHISFASQHGIEPFQIKRLPHPNSAKAAKEESIDQMLWPDHCIQGTQGCQFHRDVIEALEVKKSRGGQTHVVQKGQNPLIDGYSAFSLNHYCGFTDLPKFLFSQQPPIHTVVVVGLATDYCVMSSAIDAAKFNLRTIVVEDGVRGVSTDGCKQALQEMQSWGIEIVKTDADLSSIIQ